MSEVVSITLSGLKKNKICIYIYINVCVSVGRKQYSKKKNVYLMIDSLVRGQEDLIYCGRD